MEASKTNPLPNLLCCQNESSESGKISILSETGSVKFYLLYSLTLLNISNFYYIPVSITIVQSYTGKYHKFVAICVVTSAQV